MPPQERSARADTGAERRHRRHRDPTWGFKRRLRKGYRPIWQARRTRFEYDIVCLRGNHPHLSSSRRRPGPRSALDTGLRRYDERKFDRNASREAL